MITLAVETSEPRASVTLMQDAHVVAAAESAPRRAHGGRLLQEIDELFKKSGLKLKDVDVFAASAGPGSFTGIRVGLATISALAWSVGRRATAMGTLHVLAMSAVTEKPFVVPIMDARKGQVYGAVFQRDTTSGEPVLSELIAPCAREPAAFRARGEEQLKGRECIFVGSAVTTYSDVFAAGTNEALDIAPQATALARLVEAHCRRASSESLRAAQPRYVRPSEAELKFGVAPPFDVATQLKT